MSSLTFSSYPMVTALKASERIFGPGLSWNSCNQMQERFIKEFFLDGYDEVDQIPIIKSIASRDPEEINKFFRENGWQLQVGPFGPEDFGVASILNLLVIWSKPGKITEIKTSEQRHFPAVKIGDEGVKFFRAVGHHEPVARLQTKSHYLVYITMFDNPPEGLDLVILADQLSKNLYPSYEFSGVVFPMVDLSQFTDISWLAGLNTENSSGQPIRLFQALQQNRLKVNETGALAESLTVLTTGAALNPPPDHIINRPFLIWFEVPGLKKPLFVGYVTEENWKNPGNISGI